MVASRSGGDASVGHIALLALEIRDDAADQA
jgi:hypothetical protein